MKLTEARKKFDALRKEPSRVVVRRHAWEHHPERKFTVDEIRALVAGAGMLRDNRVDRPAPDSFVWWCEDSEDRKCEVTIRFDADQATGDLVVVISAFRRV